MRDRRIGGDDQVEAFHHGGGIDECSGSVVEIIAERLDLAIRGQASELIQSVMLLQADQPNPRQTG